MKILIKITIIFFLFTNISNADLIKPNNKLKPFDVLMIQLNSLKNNNNFYKDSGIEQTWEFAHPKNKKFTGPLDNFKLMLKGNLYSMLLNHKDDKVIEVFLSDEIATFEVTVLDFEKNYYKFKWQVEKYINEGPLKDCWLTTAVSQPVSLGSSI